MLFLINLLLLGVIYWLWLPIPEWYLSEIPARGIDLFNSVSYTSYLLKYFYLRTDGWNYAWFSGIPLSLDYPSLFFYLMLPFQRIYGLVRGVQFVALVSNFVLIISCYFLFLKLAKNRILAGILSFGVAISIGTYRALVYAGGMTFFVGQLMFPLVLYLIFKEIEERHEKWVNRRYLIFAAIVSGLGFMGHPQIFVSFVFPVVFLLLIFSPYKTLKFFSIQKIKDIVIYFFLTVLIGLPGFYPWMFHSLIAKIAASLGINVLGIASPASAAAIRGEVVEWARNQFYVAFSDTNNLIY